MLINLVSKSFLVLLLVTLWIVVDVKSAFAMDDPPPWVDVVDCEKNSQIYDGLQYCTTNDDTAHVIVIDLNAESLKIEYVIAEGYDRYGYYKECADVNLPKWSSGPGCHASILDYYPVMSLTTAAQRFDNTAVVINTDYGAGDHGKPGEHRGHGPEGFSVIRGERIDGPKYNDTDNNAENRPWLAFGQGTPIQVELNQFSSGQDNGEEADWIYTGVGGGPWLIKNGVEEEDISATCDREYGGSCYNNAAQTVIGMSSDGRWLFFVIVRSTSKDLHEAINILKDLDVKDAIKLDGGGSSQLYYGGLPGDSVQKKVVTPGDGRQLSQYLAILAQPGSGINLDEASDPPEDDSDLSWWEKIQKSWSVFWAGVGEKINDTWQQVQDAWDDFWIGLGESIEKWWQEQLSRFEEWVKQQWVDWLNQLCGSIFIVPSALSLIIYYRRKRNTIVH